MGAGGRGFYALDVTDPTNPVPQWEFCTNSALCSVVDADLGLAFGNPVITKRRIDGSWVVLLTSGYNNVSGGDGRGYLYVLDLATGAILSKTSTGVGNSDSPRPAWRKFRLGRAIPIPTTQRSTFTVATCVATYGGSTRGHDPDSYANGDVARRGRARSNL